MTLLSCFAIGLGFAIAIGLLVFAGVVIGWVIPPRRGPRKPPETPDSGSSRSD